MCQMFIFLHMQKNQNPVFLMIFIFPIIRSWRWKCTQELANSLQQTKSQPSKLQSTKQEIHHVNGKVTPVGNNWNCKGPSEEGEVLYGGEGLSLIAQLKTVLPASAQVSFLAV